MLRKSIRMLAMLMLSGVVFGLWAPQAMADSGNCDQTVVDDAHVFGDHLSQVQQAAQDLAAVGADVRVRTADSLGSFATLDALFKDTQLHCASWTGVGTNRKNNLLVFMMTVKDRKVGIFYGDQWKGAFSSTGGEGRIYANIMAPQFKRGNFAGGFIDGMDESQRVLNNFLHPQQNGNNAPSGPPVVVNKKPADLTGLWIALILIVILGAGGAGLYFFRRQRRERAAAEEERKTMRQRALSARDAASTILNQLGTDSEKAVRSAKVKKYSQVGETTAVTLKQALQDVNAHYEAATDAMSAAVSASGNAEDDNLTTGEYAQMAGRYEAALEDARAAQRASELISSTCSEIEAQLRQVSQDIGMVRGGLDQLEGAVEALKNEGIKVDVVTDHVVAATTALSQAQAHSTDLSALQDLGIAKQELKAGQDTVSTLADQRQQLSQAIPTLESRIATVQQTVAGARECFDRISDTYAPSSWEAVKGNGTEAQKRIAGAEASLKKAKDHSDLTHQRWEDALNSVQEGNLLLDKAQSLLRSITELEGNLQTAKEQAPQAIEQANADIDKAEGYLHQYEADIRKDVERDLQKARKTLAEARKELAKKLPDYLLVMKLATEAEAAADKVYDECVEEHEAAERLRRQAASTLTQAEAAVSKAEEYIDDHQSDVGSQAESNLSSAKQALQRAHSHEAAADVLRFAQSAQESAESAYARARSDFNDAEDERRRQREEREREERERQAIYVSNVSYSSHHDDSSWGSSGGSGSSFDFGGGSDGGGSSFDFGGGGSDGGGSSGSW